MAVRDEIEAASAGDVKAGPPDVRLDAVTKRFDDVVAVDHISLAIEHGAFFALLGPSGCGKTTTLRIIGGFEEPTAGAVFLGDRDVTGLPPYKRDVNTVFQSYALFPHLSIFENVAFGLRRRGVRGSELKERVADVLELVELGGLGKRKPRQLSGGEQQRVALARALVNRPRVLLLDEPLGALDLKLRKQMQLELKRIQDEVGVTFVHVTHDQDEAMTMADVIAVMNEGRIEQIGTAAELYERPRSAFVAGFLGVSNLLSATAVSAGVVRLDAGAEVSVADGALDGRRGRIAVGVRPEKISLARTASPASPDDRAGEPARNVLEGIVVERSYVGVATEFIVETAAGRLTVYAQNAAPGERLAARGERVALAWSPEATFVVDAPDDGSRDASPGGGSP